MHDCQSCNNFWCILFYLQQKYKLETKLTFLLYLSFDTGESVDRVLVHCLITGQKSVATQGLKFLSNVANEIFLVLVYEKVHMVEVQFICSIQRALQFLSALIYSAIEPPLIF